MSSLQSRKECCFQSNLSYKYERQNSTAFSCSLPECMLFVFVCLLVCFFFLINLYFVYYWHRILQQLNESSFHNTSRGFFFSVWTFFPPKSWFSWLGCKSMQVFHLDSWKIMYFQQTIVFLLFVLPHLTSQNNLVSVYKFKTCSSHQDIP